MIWSFSTAKLFSQCQRQWFFKTCLANAKAKDPARAEAYLLSKLKSLSAWRGQLVDDVISRALVPALLRGAAPTQKALLSHARRQFDRQLAEGLRHDIRAKGAKVNGRNVTAFREVEYGNELSPEAIDQAWADVEAAIRNLFEMRKVREVLKASSHLAAQRTLQFKFGGVNLKAQPDVIAFQTEGPPTIVDWKVHVFGTRDYRLQLALYAVALSRCTRHRDFPPAADLSDPARIRLLEAQLLTGLEHEYVLERDEVDELEAYIVATAAEMEAALLGVSKGNMNADDFAATRWPTRCSTCAFQKMCWAGS